jgi:hypothetical protein
MTNPNDHSADIDVGEIRAASRIYSAVWHTWQRFWHPRAGLPLLPAPGPDYGEDDEWDDDDGQP